MATGHSHVYRLASLLDSIERKVPCSIMLDPWLDQMMPKSGADHGELKKVGALP